MTASAPTSPDGPAANDFEAMSPQSARSTTGRLPVERLLRPRSIAIVGASATPGALGASVLANLDRNGFAGDIHLINPKRSEIAGRQCLATIEDLPDGVDVAVLAIPRPAVLAAVTALAARGVAAAVVFAAGFAEGGPEGVAEQQEIGRIAREAGMVVEGPNCLGAVNYVDRIPLTFVETHAHPPAGRPGIGIVSQSGAMACVLGVILASRDLGLTYSVSTGNEAASGVEDYVEFLVDDPDTRVISMIVEQFREPLRFLAAARRAVAAGKKIVLLHPGKSAAARESAATHTGAMAGDYDVMRVQVERAGVILVDTLEELGDVTEIAVRSPQMGSAGPAVLGESGAFKALTLDLAESLGLDLPHASDDDAPVLREVLPPFVGVSNPLDVTAQGLVDPDLYYRTLKAVFEDDRFGSVLLGIIQTDPVTQAIKLPPILRAVRDLKPTKPVVFAGLDEGAEVPASHVSELRELSVTYLPSPERALRAITRLVAHSERVVGPAAGGDSGAAAVDLPIGVVPEYLAKAALGPLGLSFPAGGFAATADEAVEVAERVGYPVVLKAQSAQLSHKSDAGGVILKLADADAVRAGFAQLYANVAAYDSELRLDGALVEAMGEPGLELIVGARHDADWGPVVLAGIGGVKAEITKDVRLMTADLTVAEIEAELNKLAMAPLLHGYRGSPALDVPAVAAIVDTVARFMQANPNVREIDLNPVVVYPTGAVALDALMLTD